MDPRAQRRQPRASDRRSAEAARRADDGAAGGPPDAAGATRDRARGEVGGARLRSPARLLRILHLLATAQGGGWTLSRISLALDAPKTSTYSLLRALCQEGYVRIDAARYHLGDASFALGSLIGAARNEHAGLAQLPDLAAPFLRRLAEQSGETVFISTLTPERTEAVYIARAESRHPIRFMAQVGERRPLYSSSGGRALLAFMPQYEQQAYLGSFRPQRSARDTLIDRRLLGEMIREIRATGIATTADDTHIGVSAWATPLFSRQGEAVAALIIAAPSERSRPKGAVIIEMLRRCSRELSLLMGHRPADAG